jgi:uncharacterized linocin/CFP29 family protein
MYGTEITGFAASGLTSEEAVLSKRPYIALSGKYRGQSVVTINTGKIDESGNPVYTERPIHTNATLRKDEWVNLDSAIIEAARQRLVIVDDLRSAGLVYNVGGLGAMTAEWESASEMTDAEATMDGESESEKDRQEFALNGVPIPVIQKRFKIGERVLLASRNRGAALDVTMGQEAARAVARTSERMVFYGLPIKSDSYSIPGLTNFAGRATASLTAWSNPATTTETIFNEILQMVQKMEVEERHFGPFNIYIPGSCAFQFRRDFKAFGDKTLMQRVLDEDSINAVRVADMLADGDVVMVQMESQVLDLAVGSDVTTIQWASGSGWTNHFQVFAAWAPRLKQDFDGHCGIMHGTYTPPT